MAIGGGELGAQAGADAVCLLPTHLLGLCADGKRGEGALADDAADRLPAGGDAVGANTRLRGKQKRSYIFGPSTQIFTLLISVVNKREAVDDFPDS